MLKRRSVFMAVLLILWVIFGLRLFKAEVRAVALIPRLIEIGHPGRMLSALGSLYTISENVASITPEDGTLYLLVPAGASEAEGYTQRLKYLLYPRKVVPAPQTAATGGLDRKGCLVVFIPSGSGPAPLGGRLAGLGPLAMVYEHTDKMGYQAIYRFM